MRAQTWAVLALAMGALPPAPPLGAEQRPRKPGAHAAMSPDELQHWSRQRARARVTHPHKR